VAIAPGFDGAPIAYRDEGSGRPVLLLHGLGGDASIWRRYGLPDALAAAGHRVIMPDFRGHGDSARPHDAAAYPPDVLTDDALALVAHLGLDDYDLGGYSLGARIVVRMLVRGATPRRAVVGGQGLNEVLGIGGGAGAQLRRIVAGSGTFPPGSPDALADKWFRSSGQDPVALVHVLDSLVATPSDPVRAVPTPTLVLMGSDDERAATAGDLAATLPHGSLVMAPGDHATAPATPEFIAAFVAYLADADT
jgi:pimeloyl-ACP methyl ester carboxylesterase